MPRTGGCSARSTPARAMTTPQSSSGRASQASSIRAGPSRPMPPKSSRFTRSARSSPEVLVDPDFGEVRISRIQGTYGVGTILNAKTARSQMIGGVVYGIGMCLTEATVMDGRYARVMNADLAEYHVPVNKDVPPIDIYFGGRVRPTCQHDGREGRRRDRDYRCRRRDRQCDLPRDRRPRPRPADHARQGDVVGVAPVVNRGGGSGAVSELQAIVAGGRRGGAGRRVGFAGDGRPGSGLGPTVAPGARMLVTEDGGWQAGSISGGCLEGDVLQKAWWRTRDGQPVVATYDSTVADDDTRGEELAWGFGLGCNGVVEVLLERPDARRTPLNPLHFIADCLQQGCDGVIATVIDHEGSNSSGAKGNGNGLGDVRIGQRLLLRDCLAAPLLATDLPATGRSERAGRHRGTKGARGWGITSGAPADHRGR